MPKINFTQLKIRMLSTTMLLLGVTGLSQKTNAQVLINEDFSSASGFTPPANWLNEDDGGSDAQQIWTFNNPGGRTITGGTPGFSGQFAIIDSDNDGNGNNQSSNLVTPAFNASGAGQSVFLDFDDNWEECCDAIGEVQVFDGTTWVTVFTEQLTGNGDGDEDPSVHRSIDITAAANGSTAAKVRFHYEGSWDYWWAIDNVKISKFSCTPPTASFTLTPNCPSNQFSVDINITSLGSATSLAIQDGATTLTTATATGNVTVGPFASGSTHQLTLVHNVDAGCNVSSTQTYLCPAPNDLICDALTLTIDGPSDCQTTSTATTSPDDPGNNGCSSPNNTLWYKFTPSTAGFVLVTMSNPPSGDPLDAWVSFYTVTDACGSPVYTQVPSFTGGCQEGSTGTNGSTATFLTSALSAGTQYYMMIDGVGGDFGAYCISLSTPPPPPSCVTNISPANAATNIVIDGGTDPTFSWNAATGAVSYNVYLGTTAGGETNIGNVTGTSTTISGLDISTTYYWYVVPVGLGGAATGCVSNETSFTTSAATMPPSCTYLNAPDDASTVGIFPTLSWGQADFATSYNVYLDMNTTPTTLYGNSTQTQYTGTAALVAGATYYWYVQPVNAIGGAVGCQSNVYSFTVAAPPTNDAPTNAIVLNVGQPCTGNAYTNEYANHNPGEPYPSCNIQSQGEHSVWFSFVAPTSGGVRVTTDVGTLGTLTDTKIGLFSVGEVGNYASYTLVACDDDNGVTGNGWTSTIFTTDLIGGQTYYIEVDGYSNTSQGTFCLQVEEINPTMLSGTASCADLQTPAANNPAYTGWVTLVDEAGNLVADVRNTAGGEGGNYSGSYNIDGTGFGTPRQDANGRYYLSRNYMISNSGISTPVDVRFYFHPGEIATLAGVTSNATTLSNLNVTKQESNTCNANFADANGATSILMQNANGAVNGVSWIQVSTSSFSNFYLMGGTTPLQITLNDISAANAGASNIVRWTTAKIEDGDHFELERGSDAKQFNFLAKIALNQQSSDYIFTDNNPLENENFYRLKLVSKDGKFIYSKVVSAIVSGKGFDVKAYPNPARNSVKVNVSGSQNGNITLTDIAGRVIYQGKMNGNEINIDLTKVSNGVYFLKYVDNSLTQTIKLNKQ